MRTAAIVAWTGAFAAGIAGPAAAARAEQVVANGSCREGAPHGAYELRAADGTLRAIGAYNRGRRTGSFIFWNARGVRVAHVPYDDDAVSGTVALWYAAARSDGTTVQKREAPFTAGRRNGTVRGWHADGRASVEAEYRDGELVAAKAWDGRGRAVSEKDARAAALRDASADDAEFRALEDLVRRHPPPGCVVPGASRNPG